MVPNRKCILLAALAACGAFSLAARADSVPQTKEPSSFTLVDSPILAEDAPAPRAPIMALLEKAGATSFLDKYGINVYGYVEGSYTYNTADPDNKTNFGRVFDFEHEEAIVNQVDLTVERVIADWKKLDIGGRMEWIYGADAGLIHSTGLFDFHDGVRKPENQFDLNQAYVDVSLPVGNGILIRGGKFVTLLGQEVINPTGNWLYSHSYMFGYAIPFAHTGITGSYNFNDNWGITAGITRGWDDAFEDKNDSIDFLGQVRYTSTDKKWGAIVNFVTGPERFDNNDDFRTVLDLILTCNPNDKWSFAVNADIGTDQNAQADDSDAWWYGIAGYAKYKLNDMASIAGRAEWFSDDGGTRIGVDGNFYEFTLGVPLKPFYKDRWGQYLTLRPEIRLDLSDENVFNDGEDDTQFTFGIDLIYTL